MSIERRLFERWWITTKVSKVSGVSKEKKSQEDFWFEVYGLKRKLFSIRDASVELEMMRKDKGGGKRLQSQQS